MTPEEMAAVVPHPGWGDGRRGFVWCRFDACIGNGVGLRAEVTWNDDGERHETTRYFDPQLLLQTNRMLPVPNSQLTEWVTVDQVAVPITDELAVTLVTGDPQLLVAAYAAVIAGLKKPDAETPRKEDPCPTTSRP